MSKSPSSKRYRERQLRTLLRYVHPHNENVQEILDTRQAKKEAQRQGTVSKSPHLSTKQPIREVRGGLPDSSRKRH